MIKLIDALDRRAAFADVPNLFFREGTATRSNGSVAANLRDLPPRRRAFVDNPLYFQRGGQAGFETKRGCAMQCVYCAEPAAKGSKVRLRSPEQVVEELAALLAQGIDHFHTCDSEFNLPREHAVEVCSALINSRLAGKIRWYAYCAPTPFDDRMAELFKRAGCAGIDFGVDSACDEMLRRLGRHFVSEDLARTAQICRRHRIPFMYDLLLGGPGETRDTLQQTIQFVRSVEPDCVGLSLGVRVYPCTPLAAQVRPAGSAKEPGLFGATHNNPHSLEPVFYISPALGADIIGLVRDIVDGDRRFFLPEPSTNNANYNYNDNTELVRAIAQGARGAYWDILRRMRGESMGRYD